MAPKRGRFYNVDPSPDNFRAIWDRLHDLDAQLTTAQATVAQQAATITGLQGTQTAHQQQIQQALILAGKAVDRASTTVPPAGGGGSGGGSGDSHPNHFDLVTQAKADLITEGQDLTGPCGAFTIVQRAVQYIQPSDPTAGFLAKPDGNNCNGFATDIVCYADGVIYDVLIDGGGANTPQWSFHGTVDPSRYRAST